MKIRIDTFLIIIPSPCMCIMLCTLYYTYREQKTCHICHRSYSLTYTMALKGNKKLREEKMVNNVRKSSTNQDVEDEIKLQSQLLNSLQEKVAEMEEVSIRRVNIYCTCTKIRIAIVGQSFWCQMGTK